MATPRRVVLLTATLIGVGTLAFLAPGTVEAVDSAWPAVDAAAPYFSGAAPQLFYLRVPAATLGASVLVLAPGLLIALAMGGAVTIARWLTLGFAASLGLVSVAATAVQTILGSTVHGAAFIATTTTCTALGGALAFVRVRRGARLPWALSGTAAWGQLLGLAAGLLMVLVALLPKFFGESLNGDGAHALEATRLLLHQALPFWPPGFGEVSLYPGLGDCLFTWPGSWFLRLFGEADAAARLPFILYLALLWAAVTDLAGRPGAPGLGGCGHLLLGLGLLAYALVMAFSATYDPYSSDLALPATQDTLLIVCVLCTFAAFLGGRMRSMALFLFLSLLASPGAPLLLAAWVPAVMLGFRQRPWGRLALFIGITGVGLAVLLAVPSLLDRLGLPRPGGEHDARELLRRFRYLLLTDVVRLSWVLVPAGLYPIAAFLSWRRAEAGTRALLVAAVLVFLVYYAMAFVALHYFVPAALLLLAAFWRHHRPAAWRRPFAGLAAAAAAGATAVALSLPAAPTLCTAAREIGAAIDVAALPGYAAMTPEHYLATELYTELFPKDWSPEVPDRAYGGAPLAWNHYAHRASAASVPKNYVLQPADRPPPSGTTLVAARNGAALYLRRREVYEQHRTLRPSGSLGRPFLIVPRDLLFRRKEAAAQRGIIDLRERLAALGYPGG